MRPDLARRLAAAEVLAAKVAPAESGPAYPWHLLTVEERLALLEVLDVCSTEDELAAALDARPALREAFEGVVEAAG